MCSTLRARCRRASRHFPALRLRAEHAAAKVGDDAAELAAKSETAAKVKTSPAKTEVSAGKEASELPSAQHSTGAQTTADVPSQGATTKTPMEKTPKAPPLVRAEPDRLPTRPKHRPRALHRMCPGAVYGPTREESFSDVWDEVKHVPEGPGPQVAQKMGQASPGPVRAPAPAPKFTAAQRRASQRLEARMVNQKKRAAMAKLKQEAPEIHREVVKGGHRLQSGETIADLYARNPDRVKFFYQEWMKKGAKRGSFNRYVRRRLSGDRGGAGEFLDAFVRGPEELLVKAPKSKSNVRGSDALSYRMSDKRIRYLDNKSVTTGSTIDKVSALEKNLTHNMSEDILDLQRAVLDADVPAEIAQEVIPRLKAARDELRDTSRKTVSGPRICIHLECAMLSTASCAITTSNVSLRSRARVRAQK